MRRQASGKDDKQEVAEGNKATSKTAVTAPNLVPIQNVFLLLLLSLLSSPSSRRGSFPARRARVSLSQIVE